VRRPQASTIAVPGVETFSTAGSYSLSSPRPSRDRREAQGPGRNDREAEDGRRHPSGARSLERDFLVLQAKNVLPVRSSGTGPVSALLRLSRPLIAVGLLASGIRAQDLEIHYINVGWGGSVLVRGPNGTTVLLEGGRTGMGQSVVVPYLASIGIAPSEGLDYMILGHRHTDHVGGLDEVIEAGGYDVHVASYENGSPEPRASYDSWVEAARTTTAGAPVPMPVGTVIPLGNGATLTCVARGGNLIGGGSVAVDSENDRSIAVLVQHGGFDFLWASDLGGGDDDGACTGRSSSAADVETPLIQAISPGGASPMISAGGIDVLHCNHHGAETSTNSLYMSLARPSVAVISTGAGQSTTDQRPRKDVVEKVLLANASCVSVPPALVLQTEEGNPTGSSTSFAGYCAGNILISTDGVSTFRVSADGHVTVGPDERAAAGLPRTFPLDDSSGAGDTTAPLLTDVQVTAIAGTSTTIVWTSDEASSSVVRYGPTTAYGSSASVAGLTTSHGVALAGLSPSSLYHFRVESTDQAGNTASGADGTFHTGALASYFPSATTLLQGSLRSGTFAMLATDNGSFYAVNSTTSGTRTSDWYGSTSVPVPLAAGSTLTVAYSGKNSKSANQSLHLWNWSAASWVQLDSRSVGGSEQLVSIRPASVSPYVSATGEIRLRVVATRGSNNFVASGDLMRFTIESPGSSPGFRTQ
jgi:beta-lactamase superfamily II metal-dependent hydrolase